MTLVRMNYRGQVFNVSYESKHRLEGSRQATTYEGRLVGFESQASGFGVTVPLEAKSEEAVAFGLQKVIDTHKLKGKKPEN